VIIIGSAFVVFTFSNSPAKPTPKLSLYGEVEESANSSDVFNGNIYLSNGDGVIIRGIEVYAQNEEEKTIAVEECGEIRGSGRKSISITLGNESISKIGIRFKELENAEGVTVLGLKKTSSGNLSTYQESPEEYR